MNQIGIKYSQTECFRFCENLLYSQTSKCNCSLNSLKDSVYFQCLDKFRNTPIENTQSNLFEILKLIFPANV